MLMVRACTLDYVPNGLLVERSECGLVSKCVLNDVRIAPLCLSLARQATRRGRMTERVAGRSFLLPTGRETGSCRMSTEGQQAKSKLELDLTCSGRRIEVI